MHIMVAVLVLLLLVNGCYQVPVSNIERELSLKHWKTSPGSVSSSWGSGSGDETDDYYQQRDQDFVFAPVEKEEKPTNEKTMEALSNQLQEIKGKLQQYLVYGNCPNIMQTIASQMNLNFEQISHIQIIRFSASVLSELFPSTPPNTIISQRLESISNRLSTLQDSRIPVRIREFDIERLMLLIQKTQEACEYWHRMLKDINVISMANEELSLKEITDLSFGFMSLSISLLGIRDRYPDRQVPYVFGAMVEREVPQGLLVRLIQSLDIPSSLVAN